ncbi:MULTISPECIES: S1C family serine protease [Aneurinibacillus]|uniref:Serine protease Do n=1 Tax=Aneurinibacillus thermoaerophilus TaxID=143495 RepID=A0A1G8DBK1_ANETH|nr:MULTISPECIES: trypsin-like peptidase domain-containing protein [Aneurinibacillus]AMA71482.1 serine protease [Aneurinibacillus sp. XH2]MED0675340.1 trypsin-like peptidase domain-containing protein [Aneurinibacillus thermoaerophilus]MED0679149.1 trypsin-like peptidase domain-containing protein [Aneurinibacillus thermoaerophilus]MED0738279.1 trypsin-like peptidase domain-containing protein [Aneurinibacillus thermoaerophilus]MED0757471.1 trypsin-like peptidase domain-containing protein [Aneurin
MGYYDDELYNGHKKGKRGGASTFFIALVSAIIGGLVVLMMVPTLLKSGYFPGWTALPEQPGQREPVIGGNTANYSVNVNTAIVDAVEKVENAVVGVVNIQQRRDFFGFVEEGTAGTGSGIVFRKAGGKAYIVTNYHVIERAEQVQVALANGEKNVEAKVVGADEYTDLAVLEIDGSKVEQVAEFGDSSKVKVGEPAIAIGNPLGLAFSRTVTQGIISSTERTMPVDIDGDNETDLEVNVLQTDAAINPGNSGGPLVNIAGQVIGINSMKIAKTGVEGLGFAIPIDDANKIIDDLIRYKSVQRPMLGLERPVDLGQVPEDARRDPLQLPGDVESGVVITSVTPMSPADKAGLKRYDVIVQLDDQKIESLAQLRKYLFQKRVGDTVQITFYRGSIKKSVNVTLVKQLMQ